MRPVWPSGVFPAFSHRNALVALKQDLVNLNARPRVADSLHAAEGRVLSTTNSSSPSAKLATSIIPSFA
jgi:hypothetical protein